MSEQPADYLPSEPKAAHLVPQAVDKLLANGQVPTISAVRSLIGKGSLSTIGPAVASYLRDIHLLTKPGNIMPEEVLKAFRQIWLSAVEASSAQYQDKKTEYEAVIAKHETQIQAHLSSITRLQLEANTLEANLDERQKELSACRSSLDATKAYVLELHGKLDDLHQRNASLTEKMIEAESEKTRLISDHAVALSSAQREAQAQLENAVKEERQKAVLAEDYLLKQISDLRQELQLAHDVSQKNNRELMELRASAQSIQADLKTQLHNALAESQSLAEKLSAIDLHCQQTRSENIKLSEINNDLMMRASQREEQLLLTLQRFSEANGQSSAITHADNSEK